MKLSRRASWLLLAFAAWSWLIWVVLIKNISADPRAWNAAGDPTGFLAVHVVLAIISIAMGSGIGWLGWKGLRADGDDAASDPHGTHAEAAEATPSESGRERDVAETSAR